MMSNKKITLPSRIIATLLGKSPWQTPWQCFVERVTGKCNFSTNAAMQHGLKYESDAVEVYKLHTKNRVQLHKETFHHPEFHFITGKIDGLITTKNGKKAILEVKCPFTKKFPNPNEDFCEISNFYWTQVQIYMEILGVGETHFVEYYRQENRSLFRYQIIYRDLMWFQETIPKIKKFHREITHYKNIGIEMHPVYEVIQRWENDDLERLEEEFEEKLAVSG